MSAQVLAGFHVVFACALALAGAFFIQAWRLRRRDVDYLLFGLTSVALGGYAAGTAWLSWGAAFPGAVDFDLVVGVMAAFAVSSVALLLHLSLIHI